MLDDIVLDVRIMLESIISFKREVSFWMISFLYFINVSLGVYGIKADCYTLKVGITVYRRCDAASSKYGGSPFK